MLLSVTLNGIFFGKFSYSVNRGTTYVSLLVIAVCLLCVSFPPNPWQVWLALSGILSTAMAIGMSFGLCSAFGLLYGPIHSSLPFLLIGEILCLSPFSFLLLHSLSAHSLLHCFLLLLLLFLLLYSLYPA